LGKWGKLNDKAELVFQWKKRDDSTFVEEGTFKSSILPDSLRAFKTTTYLQLRNDTIWKIANEGDKKWRSILIGSSQNSLSFKSLDDGDLETVIFYGDSIVSDNVYKHQVKQRFVYKRLK
jgi:hypothetical protein